ncbi:30S ribosomal protein S7 [Patescibacteria group bacterium]|nr:30S ribosomal protein S7 [Patescibacteria group bacterium]MBU1868770.1 30S ribosomal protein S7 [Patescibacteria group bacterium]
MPRKKGRFKKVTTKPDPKYQSIQVAKLVSKVMQGGKKDVARRIVYSSFAKVEKDLKKNPAEVFDQAIANAKPQQEVRSRRVGGATYQVPLPVRKDRAESLAMRWIVSFAKAKNGPMEANLAQEIIAAYNGEGDAIKKREDIRRMAESNRAFAHFRW